jgi:hypothetical protein
LVGFFHLREEIRMFASSLIRPMKETGQVFEPSGRSHERHGSWRRGIHQSENPQLGEIAREK